MHGGLSFSPQSEAQDRADMCIFCFETPAVRMRVAVSLRTFSAVSLPFTSVRNLLNIVPAAFPESCWYMIALASA